jgi:hypothetical protein
LRLRKLLFDSFAASLCVRPSTTFISMPSTYFYADADDAATVVAAVLADGRLEAWEASSQINEQSRRVSEVAHDRYVTVGIVSLALYASVLGPRPTMRRIELRADVAGPGAFREFIEGWGVIQLQFTLGLHQTVGESRVACNSEARAHNWADTYRDTMGDPAAWDWSAVQREYRRVGRLIRQRAVANVRGALVLPSIAAKVKEGLVRLNRSTGPGQPDAPPA